MSFNRNDIDILERQLRSKEISISGVLKRCRYGFPQVIFLNPIIKDGNKNRINFETVSNIMWLTCPYLNYEIHELENASYIHKIQIIIRDNAGYKKMMLAAHAHYYFARNLLFEEFAEIIPDGHIDFFKNGIGGIRDFSAIKCLHQHFSHYFLCRDNIAGLMTYRLLGEKIECDDCRCGML